MKVTEQKIIETYTSLRGAAERATYARESLLTAQFALKEAEAQVWPGANETERKAAKMSGTQEARLAEQKATRDVLIDEHVFTLALLALDEIHDLLRLAELEK